MVKLGARTTRSTSSADVTPNRRKSPGVLRDAMVPCSSSAAHAMVVGGRDPLDQRWVDPRGADRLELDADAPVGLGIDERAHVDPVTGAAQHPRRAVLLRDTHALLEHCVAGGG